MTHEDLAKRPPHDALDVLVQVLGSLHERLALPACEYCVFLAAVVDFFDVVVHVLDEQDVIVEHLFVLGVGALLSAHGGRLARDLLEAYPHCLVDAVIGCVDHGAHFHEIGSCGRAASCARIDVLDADGEVGKYAHECDDAFAFLDLDFCVLNRPDLVVDELGEEIVKSRARLCKRAKEEFL